MQSHLTPLRTVPLPPFKPLAFLTARKKHISSLFNIAKGGRGEVGKVSQDYWPRLWHSYDCVI